MLRKFSAIQKYKFCLRLCTHLEHRNYLLLTKISYNKKNNSYDDIITFYSLNSISEND